MLVNMRKPSPGSPAGEQSPGAAASSSAAKNRDEPVKQSKKTVAVAAKSKASVPAKEPPAAKRVECEVCHRDFSARWTGFRAHVRACKGPK